jgi:protein involved in polysaccharide export with SLBB domain
VRQGTNQFFDRQRTTKRRRLFVIAGLLLLVLRCAPAARAQQKTDDTTNSRDLTTQNLSRVAASAAALKSVLQGDAGLMVELKRWVAKDASSHGQIVTEPDLTDSAIFERLDTDVLFRSVATDLVQRYGYLVPKLNPDSDAGKENALLMQERAKWLAQSQEEELAQARRPGVPSAQDTATPKQPAPQSAPAPRTLPVAPSPQRLPAVDENTMMRAQVAQPGQDLNALNVSQPLGPQGGGVSSILSAGQSPVVESPSDALVSAYENSASPLVPAVPASRRTAPIVLDEPPQLARKSSPYAGIPSLYDMYVQAVTTPAALKRFGLNVFENGTQDSQLIPMDLPAGPDYVVGPGDGLSVDLWGGVSQRLYRTVDREGRISLPEVGPILVSGKSLAAVQQSLQLILRTQFRDVSADVSLARLRSVRIYEVGDVANPGAYDISSLSTPLNALFAAGGPTPRGSLRILKHYRGTQLLQTVDVYDLLLHGVKTDLERMENGDTVQVPPIGPQVTVDGMVRRPAIYELRDEKTLASVLELAGGLLPAATLSHIEVQRMVAHDKQTMLSLDIPETNNASEVTKKLESFEIQDGDQIRIYPIAPYNLDTIFVEGHVLRPGRYSFREGMRVTDAISSYKDLLPEPAIQYAEIVRLNGPDFHPSVEAFDLGDALADPSRAPVLHAMDTVRIFSRFDFEDTPSVSVMGDVRQPGNFQTSGQIHLSDAVHLAGGLTPDAQTTEAQMFRYLPDGKLKVFSVGLGQALEGDPVQNIIMQPRDRLLIHRKPDAVEQATVYIQGEVAKPGRYPLTQVMRVSDLIRLGGGLKNSADTEIADLAEYLLQNKTAGTGTHHEVHVTAALAGTPTDDLPLHQGDTLTIRQIPGWNDLGALVSVGGEVAHPGKYGIQPGERLSSVLARAGGFLPTAYPRGIIFQRDEVRQLEQKSRDELILRIRQEGTTFKTSIKDTGQDQMELAQAALAQRNSAIEALQQAPVMGRLVVRMPSDLAHFRGSPDDIELRRGDAVFIPKEPQFVLVNGQVYNSNAITYRAHHDARWYLRQAGGPTDQANQKAIFIIRVNGSVVSNQGSGLWDGGVLTTAVEPGDSIVVPEKAIGGTSAAWKNVIAISQLAEAAAMTAFIATH